MGTDGDEIRAAGCAQTEWWAEGISAGTSQ